MADNYLERQREDYERRKQAMSQAKGKHKHPKRKCNIPRPDDEAL